MKGTKLLALLAIVSAFFFNGCASGPPYLYTPQKDSALIALGPAPTQHKSQPQFSWDSFWSGFLKRRSSPDDAVVSVQQVDGLQLGMRSPFDFHHPYLDSAGNIAVSPGTHTLAIFLGYGYSDSQTDGQGGTTTTETSTTVTAQVTVAFATNHRYRFNATLFGEEFRLYLTDETGASAISIQNWTYIGQVSVTSSYTPPFDANKPKD